MRIKKTILIILVIANVFSWSVVFWRAQDKGLEVCFFDVGQADSIFIESPQDHQILIDGGPDDTVLEKLEETMPFWDKTIDLIVLTHPEKDHVFGLVEVLKKYQVENVLWTGVNHDSLLFQEWQKTIEKEGAKIWIAKNDLNIEISKSQYFDILYPFESLEGREVSSLNDTSVVMMLNTDGGDILFAGDISEKAEKLLVDGGAGIDADILKVPHHGSKASSSEEFIEEVSPDLAIISVGENNPYGHPAPEVLARLEDFGIKVLQTSKEKDICLIQKKKEPFYLLNPTQ